MSLIPKEQFSILLGNKVREIREEKGLTRASLAECADLHENSIKSVENGDKVPSIYTIYKISICLELELGELMSQI